MEFEEFRSSNFFICKTILDDLCSRFILLHTNKDNFDFIRLFFQIELAYWFYLDFYCDDRSNAISILDFARCIFQHVNFLKPFCDEIEPQYNIWKEFKREVPTNGAIVLSEDFNHVLLVQAEFHKECWGFPKGKMMEDETYENCAVREVLEEIGLNVKDEIDANCFIECQKHGKITRLYIVSGVDMNTEFGPRTRNEIRQIKWFKLDDLPCHKRDLRPLHTVGIHAQSFSTIIPFVKPLRRYVGRKRGYLNYCDSDSVDTVGQHIQIHYGEIDENITPKSRNDRLLLPLHGKHGTQMEHTSHSSNVRQQRVRINSIKVPRTRQNYTPPPRFQKMKMQKKKLSDEDSGFELTGSDDQGDSSLTSTASYTSSEDLSEDSFLCENISYRILRFDGPSRWKLFKFDLKDVLHSLMQ